MSFEGHFIHTCNIQRNVESGEDRHSNPQAEAIDVVAQEPCRLVETEERIRSDETAESTVITTYKLFLSPGVDIQERDIVSQIILEDGNPMNSVFAVKNLLPRRSKALHHKTVLLERIS